MSTLSVSTSVLRTPISPVFVAICAVFAVMFAALLSTSVLSVPTSVLRVSVSVLSVAMSPVFVAICAVFAVMFAALLSTSVLSVPTSVLRVSVSVLSVAMSPVFVATVAPMSVPPMVSESAVVAPSVVSPVTLRLLNSGFL